MARASLLNKNEQTLYKINDYLQHYQIIVPYIPPGIQYLKQKFVRSGLKKSTIVLSLCL